MTIRCCMIWPEFNGNIVQQSHSDADVELRRHHAERTKKWMSQIIGKDNGAVAWIVRK